MPNENLIDFIQNIENYCKNYFQNELPKPILTIDAKLNLAQITSKFYAMLLQFSPFGAGNMRPVFYAENIQSKFQPYLLKEQHLKLKFETEDGQFIEAIGFNMSRKWELVQLGCVFNMAFVVSENYFKGQKKLQLEIREIR